MGRAERFRPSVWHVTLVVPVFAVGIGIHQRIRDNSFLWHVTAGRLQAAEGAVLTADPFSFTAAGEPWRTQSWLIELWYSSADGWWGFAYVPWMVWALSATLFAGVLLIGFRGARSLVAMSTLAILSVVIAVAFLNPRPVIFSYVLFVLVVLAEGDRRMRWTLPLLLWIWAASHGSFVIGAAYLLFQAIRRMRWSAWRELVAAGVLVSMTAHGWGVWQILLDFTQNRGALEKISEWASPDLISVPMAPLFAAIVVFFWGGMKGRLVPRDLVVIVPFLALAFDANRSVLPAWIGLAPFIAIALGPIRVPGRPPSLVVGRVNTVLISALLIAPLLVPMHTSLNEKRFPVDASEVLASDRLFHDDSTGGFLIYAQWPRRLVFVDDRAELYGEEFFSEYQATLAAQPGWDKTLADWEITEILLPRSHGLLEAVRLAGWAEVYRDEEFVVMRKS